MSKIEDTHERIEKAKGSLSESRYPAAEYERYNRYMIWKKADLYLKKSNEVNAAKQHPEEQIDKISTCEQVRQDTADLLEKSEIELKTLKEEQNGLNISDIKEHLRQKKERSETPDQAKKTAAEKQKNIEDKQQRVNAKYRECSEIKNNIDDCKYEINKTLSDLQDHEEYCFPFYDEYYRKIKNGERLQAAECRQECRVFSERLKQVLDLLNERDRQIAEYETAEQRLSERQTDVYKCQKSLETAQSIFNEQKDGFIEQLYVAKNNNKEFCIDEELLRKPESLVEKYEGEGSGRDIYDAISNYKLRLSETLHEVIASAEQEKNNKENICNDLKERLKELQKTAEPLPERSADRIAARKVLADRGVSFRSFYECIDFKQSVSETQRTVLEAELKDMGLPDALVISKTDREKAASLLGELSDCCLVYDKPVSDMGNSFLEVTYHELAEETRCILSQLKHSCGLARTDIIGMGSWADILLDKRTFCISVRKTAVCFGNVRSHSLQRKLRKPKKIFRLHRLTMIRCLNARNCSNGNTKRFPIQKI